MLTDLALAAMFRKHVRFLMLLSIGFVSQTTFAEAPKSGRLVIVGGALDPKHEAVYQSLLVTASDTEPVAIVPLASGVPEESGPLSVQDIQQFAKNPERVFDTKLVYTDPEKAKTQESALSLEKCGAIWFTGGDQSRIVDVMRPVTGDTVCYEAVIKVLSDGGTIGGSSAGAAMMSDPMIRSGESDTAMLLGATTELDGPGVCIGKGMGLFPYGLSDQHFLQRGRFGRLLAALEATDNQLGFGVNEDSALVVDLNTDALTMVGDEAVVVIDRKDAIREGLARKNVRVSLLGEGDLYNPVDHKATPAAPKTKFAAKASDASAATSFPSIWRRDSIRKMLKALAADPTKPILSDDENFDYQFSADEGTQFYFDPEKKSTAFTAISVRLDITPRAGIEEKIKKAKSEYAKPTPAK